MKTIFYLLVFLSCFVFFLLTSYCTLPIFSSFMLAHAQAMNEYRRGEMSTEVVVDRNLWTVDGSESVLRAWLHGRTFDFRVHGPSSRPVLSFFILVFVCLFFLLKMAYNGFFILCNTI